ncbi:TRAP transporter small permease [Oceaniglobus trochenteri]|uniref:TRAP transporter small permease n=1 Tax=Oceaniglobus trochenteri TaxID=2763260 RepID=UPI001CFFBA58|nr:TRAP transporter small permease [Oceaniglobus trochenteri]
MHGFFLTLSRAMAWLGGLVLLALILLTCVSVTGRALSGLSPGIGPVRGDFELIEAGIAFCIFAFLPLCQITGGHATVEIFTTRWSGAANRWRQMLTDVTFAAVLIVIAIQLAAGMESKLRSGQTTFLLEFPLWWAYGASLAGACVAAMVATYIAMLRLAELALRRPLLPATTDPEA